MLICYLQMLDTAEEKTRFEQIYLKYRSLMYHVADGILRNRQDAEDAVHNAFLRIMKHFERRQNVPAQDMAPLVTVIARNKAISLQRKRRGETPLEDWDGFAETLEAVTDYHALVALFTRLPQTYRTALEMKLLLGCSDGEIAARLGLSKTAVSTRISRGRQHLLSKCAVLAVSAEAREALTGWVREVYKSSFIYRFFGTGLETPAHVLYRPAYVPSGYQVKEEFVEKDLSAIIYYNNAHELIAFTWFPSASSPVIQIVRDGIETYKRVSVNGMSAELYLDRDEGEANILIWIDEREGAIFCLHSPLGEMELVRIAESVGNTQTAG